MGVLEKPVVLKASSLIDKQCERVCTREFSYPNLVGRLIELNGSRNAPILSFLSLIIREVQAKGEAVVWVGAADSVFYPPDFVVNGIDLRALPVVWVPDVKAGIRALEHLLRSNSFGLLVIDLPLHTIIDQGRLGKLARMADVNQATVVFINNQEDGVSFTLGSIISLRLAGMRVDQNSPDYTCVVSAVKDKRDQPGWSRREVFHAPDSMY